MFQSFRTDIFLQICKQIQLVHFLHNRLYWLFLWRVIHKIFGPIMGRWSVRQCSRVHCCCCRATHILGGHILSPLMECFIPGQNNFYCLWSFCLKNICTQTSLQSSCTSTMVSVSTVQPSLNQDIMNDRFLTTETNS